MKEVEQSKEENGSKSKKQIYEVIRRCDKNEYVAMDVLVRVRMAFGNGNFDIRVLNNDRGVHCMEELVAAAIQYV
ncbi:MAG: DUF4869 domain-containing protein [Schaedlerella sp.]|uniref:hypothetical protein n=1 Tax=Schaedlerella sp. TaxID=2676057 RepID=UPI0035281829